MTDHATTPPDLFPPRTLNVHADLGPLTSFLTTASADSSSGSLAIGEYGVVSISLYVSSVDDAKRLADAAAGLHTLMVAHAEARAGQSRATARGLAMVRATNDYEARRGGPVVRS